jgi:hypothetical protein
MFDDAASTLLRRRAVHFWRASILRQIQKIDFRQIRSYRGLIPFQVSPFLQEVELESIRQKLAGAADTKLSNKQLDTSLSMVQGSGSRFRRVHD